MLIQGMSLPSVKCKPVPHASTAEKLSRTVNQFAKACNYALRVARRDNLWNKFALQRAVYRELRERFGLSANLAVRAIARVGKRKGHKVGGFKATSVDYDQRILSVNVEDETVSLSTVEGRVKVAMRIAGYQRHLLRTAKSIQGGQLVRGRDTWYIHLWCEYDDPPPLNPTGVLGVDLGIVNIASDSDGETHSGKHLNSVRHRHRRLRKKLQKKGTKGAKRRLKKLSGKEARFANHVNHRISKRIEGVRTAHTGSAGNLVAKAQRTERAIALEDLQGIRERVRLRTRCIAGRFSTWARSSGTRPSGPAYRWSSLTQATPPGSALLAGTPREPTVRRKRCSVAWSVGALGLRTTSRLAISQAGLLSSSRTQGYEMLFMAIVPPASLGLQSEVDDHSTKAFNIPAISTPGSSSKTLSRSAWVRWGRPGRTAMPNV